MGPTLLFWGQECRVLGFPEVRRGKVLCPPTQQSPNKEVSEAGASPVAQSTLTPTVPVQRPNLMSFRDPKAGARGHAELGAALADKMGSAGSQHKALWDREVQAALGRKP